MVFPENSLAAFVHARQSGAHLLEVDLRRSADGKLYCYHDRQLARLTGFKGEFEKTDSSVIDSLRLKLQEPVLSFESFLSNFGGKIGIVLDIKSERVEEDIVSLTSRLSDRFPLVYSSFHPEVITRIRELLPSASTALIVGPLRNLRPRLDITEYLLRLGQRIGCGGIHLSRRLAGRKRIGRLIAEGFSLCLWTIDDGPSAEKYLKLGVSGIITNTPGELIRYLAAAGGGACPSGADDAT
jgi:glycerophosphoryl diester phosphodiesterase